MRLDTYLEDDNRSIIIDTKYKRFYSERKFKNNNNEFGISKTYVSENLYQMFTYITQIETTKNITGIILYPVTNNLEEIDETYNLKNFYKENCEDSLLKIYTINLNNPWRRVKDDLIKLVS
jgi:5-methylcytosine-specific restriction enzyme subunit McrC